MKSRYRIFSSSLKVPFCTSPPTLPQATNDMLSITTNQFTLVQNLMHHVLFCIWLIFTQHVFEFYLCFCVSVFRSFSYQVVFYCTDIPQFVSSSICGRVMCFHLLAIVNKGAMNICVQVSVWTYFNFFLVNTWESDCWAFW